MIPCVHSTGLLVYTCLYRQTHWLIQAFTNIIYFIPVSGFTVSSADSLSSEYKQVLQKYSVHFF